MINQQNTEKIHILSRSMERFANRVHAGLLLAGQLKQYADKHTVVLGIPRGGVIVAHEIARKLNADLDINLAHKLRTPGDLELAMGSISENGGMFLNQDVVQSMQVSRQYIEEEKAVQMEEIKRRVKLFRAGHPKISLAGRIVIIVDDGIATGATTHAAIQSARMEKPQKLILAVPVAGEDTLLQLAPDVDEIICLKSPPGLMGVGQVYARFDPVTDEEVLEILNTYQVKDIAK